VKTNHANWANVVIAANLFVGIWGVYLWRKKATAPKSFWYALSGAWATIYVQGILGLIIYQGETKKPSLKHTFYGFLFVVITIAVFPLRSGEKPRSRLAAFAFATLFIGIVAIRARFAPTGI
jgi:hypothetical protein